MNTNWQIARGQIRRGRPQRPAYVSINKRGEIAMNDRAFAAIERPASVTLLYLPPPRHRDGATPPLAGGELRGTIGIKCPVARDGNFFMARRYGRDSKMHIVRARRALKQFGLSVEHTLKFYNPPVIIYRNEPMLVLELDVTK